MMTQMNVDLIFINPVVSMENEMRSMPKNEETVKHWID
jgi:hypothetical protein